MTQGEKLDLLESEEMGCERNALLSVQSRSQISSDTVRRQPWAKIITDNPTHRNPCYLADNVICEYDKRFPAVSA